MTKDTLTAQLQAKCARCGLQKSEWSEGRWKHPLCRVGETSYETHTLVTKDIHNKSDEEIVEEFKEKFTQKTNWADGDWCVLTGEQPEPIIDWLRTTLTNVRLSEAKKREELLEKACGVLRNEEECKSGCGCATHTAYHEGSCVWVPKEYFTVEEVEATIKNLLDDKS